MNAAEQWREPEPRNRVSYGAFSVMCAARLRRCWTGGGVYLILSGAESEAGEEVGFKEDYPRFD